MCVCVSSSKRKSTVNIISNSKDDADAPTLGSYDGCCDDVGQQGQHQVAHLGDVDDEGEFFMDPSPLWSNEQAGPHRDRSQVNDWEKKVKSEQTEKEIQAGLRVSSARRTTGVIKMALFRSGQMTQARQTTTPSVMTN